MWKGRFKAELSQEAVEFSSSIAFDGRLYEYDIQGSVAYAEALNRAGVLTDEELRLVLNGLDEVRSEIKEGKLVFDESLEDVHMNIEAMLTEKVGDVGKKLHTGRSRNEQVLVDLKLYLKEEVKRIREGLRSLCRVVVELADGNMGVVMPAFTHMQPAQPVLLSHYLMSFFWAFYRDLQRLDFVEKQVDVLPLGVGAVAGTTVEIDREFLMRRLGFSALTHNSMDTVADRDFVLEFLFWCAIFMSHVSRLSEDFVLFSTPFFSFLKIPDEFSTGSSMMPQKKNPDMFELARGKASRVYGNLVSVLTLVKGLPSGYNRDLQEDKERLFDSVDTVKAVLEVLVPMLKGVSFDAEAMRSACRKGFILATDVADYLVKKGVPFRDAHHIVGRAVRYCLDEGKDFSSMTLEEWRLFYPNADEEIKDYLCLEAAVQRRKGVGGTSADSVREQIRKAMELVGEGGGK